MRLTDNIKFVAECEYTCQIRMLPPDQGQNTAKTQKQPFVTDGTTDMVISFFFPSWSISVGASH